MSAPVKHVPVIDPAWPETFRNPEFWTGWVPTDDKAYAGKWCKPLEKLKQADE